MLSRRPPVSPDQHRVVSRRRRTRHLHLETLEARELLTTYGVGPGQAYGTLGAVPWTSLAAGDTVAIQWQASGYHEKLLISQSGTASQPINIVGIPGPQGQQPVIDGANATTSAQFHYYYSPQQTNSLVLIQRSADQNYNYKPSYINISGLEFRDAYQGYSFKDASGASQNYNAFAAAIYIEGANNITLRNNTLDNSGLGLFALSNGDEAHTTRNVMVDGNSIYGNGVPGQYLEHNVYTEAVGITFQYNNFGPLRAGAIGNELKDRSAGTVIRYNNFATGGHILDLVDPEDSSIVAQDPSFTNTYVYGNVLDNSSPDGATFLVHFGGDSGNTSIYRHHLEFYDNTVLNRADQTGANGRWRTILFQMDTNQQSANAYNNIISTTSATPGASPTSMEMIYTDGVANFGANWVSPGWAPSYDAGPVNGIVTGGGNFYVNPNNNPGFVNPAAGNYQLAAGSSAIGRGVAIASGDPAVTMQYLAPTSGTTRSSVADFGAFASGTKLIPTVVSTTPSSSATGVSTSASIAATFNEAVASGLSFLLAGPSGAVASTFTYADPAHTATLVPAAPLLASTTYTATIGGARDAAGNAMSTPYSWSFTTTAAAVIPTVVSTTPSSSATGVSTSASIAATFNEAIASGLSFLLVGPSGAAVASTFTYADPAHIATLVPAAPLLASTTYTATIGGARDAAGNAMSAAYSWSFTTAAAAAVTSTASLWASSTTPAVASDNDTNALEVGVKFTSDSAGFITGLRFYKGPANTGTHVGHLWTSSGTLLATATFTSETDGGWQQVNLAKPVAIAANTRYVASYFAPVGGYAADVNYFAATYDRTPLHAPAKAGVYVYGGSGGFPTSTYQASNYWVDVVFAAGTKAIIPTTGVIKASASVDHQSTPVVPLSSSSITVPLTPSDFPPASATTGPDAGFLGVDPIINGRRRDGRRS